MIVVVPADTPPITPVVRPIVATEVLLLLHIPPGNVLFNVVVRPSHTTGAPVMAEGNGFIVTLVVTKQLKGEVYVVIAAPAATPPNTPVVAPIVATEVLLLVQVPPGVASLNVLVDPWHMDVLPTMPDGRGFTVIVVVLLHPAVVM